MFNILVVDDNLSYSKSLINYLLKNNSQIHLACIATNGKEAISYLNSPDFDIDIILLDLKLPFYNGLDVIKELLKKGIKKYEKSIIVMSGSSDMLSLLINNRYIYSFLPKSKGLERILEEVDDLIKIKNDYLIEDKIIRELRYLNYNEKYIGTKYIFESILLIAKQYDRYCENLKKDIFPIIASKYNKTVHNIKCNINNATTYMNVDCKKEIVMEYFNFDNEKTEAKPKQVIFTILNKILE